MSGLAFFSILMASGGDELNLNNNGTVDDIEVGAAVAGIIFNSDGSITYIGNNTPADPSDEWWTGSSVDGSLYEVAFTALVAGTAPEVLAAALGVFIALSANRTYTFQADPLETITGTWRFRVRRIADNSDFAEADIPFRAEAQV